MHRGTPGRLATVTLLADRCGQNQGKRGRQIDRRPPKQLRPLCVVAQPYSIILKQRPVRNGIIPGGARLLVPDPDAATVRALPTPVEEERDIFHGDSSRSFN